MKNKKGQAIKPEEGGWVEEGTGCHEGMTRMTRRRRRRVAGVHYPLRQNNRIRKQMQESERVRRGEGGGTRNTVIDTSAASLMT